MHCNHHTKHCHIYSQRLYADDSKHGSIDDENDEKVPNTNTTLTLSNQSISLMPFADVNLETECEKLVRIITIITCKFFYIREPEIMTVSKLHIAFVDK